MKDGDRPRQPDSWRRPRLCASGRLAAGSDYRLAADEVSYLTKVLRLRDGDEVYLFDGRGRELRARLIRCRRGWMCRVGEPVDFPGADPLLQVHIGQGSAPRGRGDWAVEKMTELGAASITPLVSFGTSRRDPVPDQRQRWRRLTAAAAAQCGRRSLPQLGAPMGLEEWSAALPEKSLLLLLSLAPDAARLSEIAADAADADSVALIVGRLSGLDEDEEAACIRAGFRPASMGKRVLRIETAGATALAILFAAAGEM